MLHAIGCSWPPGVPPASSGVGHRLAPRSSSRSCFRVRAVRLPLVHRQAPHGCPLHGAALATANVLQRSPVPALHHVLYPRLHSHQRVPQAWRWPRSRLRVAIWSRRLVGLCQVLLLLILSFLQSLRFSSAVQLGNVLRASRGRSDSVFGLRWAAPWALRLPQVLFVSLLCRPRAARPLTPRSTRIPEKACLAWLSPRRHGLQGVQPGALLRMLPFLPELLSTTRALPTIRTVCRSWLLPSMRWLLALVLLNRRLLRLTRGFCLASKLLNLAKFHHQIHKPTTPVCIPSLLVIVRLLLALLPALRRVPFPQLPHLRRSLTGSLCWRPPPG